MSIIEIIDKSLKSNTLLEIVKEYKNTSMPLEIREEIGMRNFNKYDTYIDTASYYVAPKNKLLNIDELKDFMNKIIPEQISPTEIYQFRFDENLKPDSHGVQTLSQNHTPKKLIFGQVHYIEDIGVAVENTKIILHDEKLLKKFNEKKEHTLTTKLYRKVTIYAFPHTQLASEIMGEKGLLKAISTELENDLKIHYYINLSDLKNLK